MPGRRNPARRDPAERARPPRRGPTPGPAARPASGGGAGKRKLPRDPRALADAVFARVDPEEIAVELLGKESSKREKLQILSLLLAYKFGKPAQRVEATGPGGGPVPVVWDIPRPARETPGPTSRPESAEKDDGLD